MVLDQELIKAVEEAVKQVNQSPEVASRIAKWLEGMSIGDISRADMDEYFKMTLNSIRSQVTSEGA